MKRKSSAAARRKPNTRDREATQQALIVAGERLFAVYGFDGTTLDMLAAESGANKALVSYYFGSKEGLYDAVIAALTGEAVAMVSSALIDGGDPVKNFRRYVKALARAFAARPTFPAILMREYIAGSMLEREGPFRQVIQFYRMTEKFYEAGRKEKLFRKLDPHKLHLSIVGPLVHFILTMGLRERILSRFAADIENPTVDAFAAHLARLVLDGMRRGE